MGCCCSGLQSRISEQFSGTEILRQEVCSAQKEYRQSDGCCPVQGSGALVLTRHNVWFTMACCPERTVDTPIPNLNNVSTCHTFRGPGRFIGSLQSLLVLKFVDPESGEPDVVVYRVRDAKGWARDIQQVWQQYKQQAELKAKEIELPVEKGPNRFELAEAGQTNEPLADEPSITCGICSERKIHHIALVPCGHAQFCSRCISAVRAKNDEAKCPTCRSVITDVLQIYT